MHRNHHKALQCSAVYTRTRVCTHKQNKTTCEPRTLTLKRKKEFQTELGKCQGGGLVQHLAWKFDMQKICSKMKMKLSNYYYFFLICEDDFELA